MSLFEKIVAREPVATPARIAPLANLPLFHKLHGRKVVVAGGSEGALWKAELLTAAGADVLVLAGDGAGAQLFAGLELALQSSSPAKAGAQPFANPEPGPRPSPGNTGKLKVCARAWQPDDLTDAALAIGDIGDRDEALRFRAAARVAGAPANIVDQTELCDFLFGTIVNRSPVVLAISTDGAAPMLGQSIRARIESVLPLGLSAWADAAKSWRPRLKGRVHSFSDRRAFWERFTMRAWDQVARAPNEDDFGSLMAAMSPNERGGKDRGGSVTLVGAGPGDPELLTLKAVRALQTATVILYDDLVGPDILELARREARRVAVGKTGHGPSCSQAEINRRIVELAAAGERVVRLKGGDPLIFGRATEEIDACRAAGIPASIVPGISAAQGAAAALGFSLTERKAARRVQFVTGHSTDGTLPDDIDWTAIADPHATTVVYMPRKTLGGFLAKARAAGLAPDTPALAIASATRAEQAHVSGSVLDIAALADGLIPGAPVTVIIGEVARHRAVVSVLPALSAAA